MARKAEKTINRICPKKIARIINRPFAALEKELSHIARIYQIFQPFIYDHHYIFHASSITSLQAQEEEFNADVRKIDWEHYWLNIHMRGLAKWIFPKYKAGFKATGPILFAACMPRSLSVLALDDIPK